MNLMLTRKYHPEGTNGEIFHEGKLICYSIELPWKENSHGISCIPEGRYLLVKRYSEKFKWHLHVTDVKDRSFILIHPANDAQKELNGCIAPVSGLTGYGKGSLSRMAFEKVKSIVFPELENNKLVYLIVGPTPSSSKGEGEKDNNIFKI